MVFSNDSLDNFDIIANPGKTTFFQVVDKNHFRASDFLQTDILILYAYAYGLSYCKLFYGLLVG